MYCIVKAADARMEKHGNSKFVSGHRGCDHDSDDLNGASCDGRHGRVDNLARVA
jgi:hypothetical protein